MLTDRDYELLSDFLDDALSETERANLEKRLSAEAELRRELEALSATVALVKSLPALQAPRNFTLDASMVRRPASRRILLSPVFYSALSAAAVLMIGFGLLLLTQSQSAPTASAPQQGQQGQEGQQGAALALLPTETVVTKSSDDVLQNAITESPVPPPQPFDYFAQTDEATRDDFSPSLAPSAGETTITDGSGAPPGGPSFGQTQPDSGSILAEQSEPTTETEIAAMTSPIILDSPVESTIEFPLDQLTTTEEFNSQSTELNFGAPAAQSSVDTTVTTDTDTNEPTLGDAASNTAQRQSDTPAPTDTLTPTLQPSATDTETLMPTLTPAPTSTPAQVFLPSESIEKAAPAASPVNVGLILLVAGAVLLLVAVISFFYTRRNR